MQINSQAEYEDNTITVHFLSLYSNEIKWEHQLILLYLYLQVVPKKWSFSICDSLNPIAPLLLGHPVLFGYHLLESEVILLPTPMT